MAGTGSGCSSACGQRWQLDRSKSWPRRRTCRQLLFPLLRSRSGQQKTFFAHFCAGEDGVAIRPVVHALRAQGVTSILDYSTEADLGHAGSRADQVASWQQNTAIKLASVADAAPLGNAVAIKITALCDPELLLVRAHLFRHAPPLPQGPAHSRSAVTVAGVSRPVFRH